MKYSDEFEIAYQKWPKPGEKFDAWILWQRIARKEKQWAEVFANILAALAWQVPIYRSTRSGVKFVPSFRRWLHGRMWDDDAVDGMRKPLPMEIGSDRCKTCGYTKTIHTLVALRNSEGRESGFSKCCTAFDGGKL